MLSYSNFVDPAAIQSDFLVRQPSHFSSIWTAFFSFLICNRMGANITINDIDIAHRVSFRDSSRSEPKPIICKFVRRFAKNNVMAMRRHAASVAARDVGLEEGRVMSKILILDHLIPRMQELYGTAKSFKTRFGFQFCWAKNGTIFLRK